MADVTMYVPDRSREPTFVIIYVVMRAFAVMAKTVATAVKRVGSAFNAEFN